MAIFNSYVSHYHVIYQEVHVESGAR
jgi:hypothetical protein